MDEALGRPQPPLPWRAWHNTDDSVQSSPKRRAKNFVLTACVLGLIGTAYWVLFTPNGVTPGSRSSTENGVLWPTAGREAKQRPLGKPPIVGRLSDSHRFVYRQRDSKSAVAYDPCRPIHYVVRPDGEPQGGGVLIRAAVARISAATGLKFIADGPTDEAPSRERSPFQPDIYGDRWAPVLIAWVMPEENPDFAASVAGEAGSTAVALPEAPRVLVTGQMQLDASKFAELLQTPPGGSIARGLVLHEFGHLLGLDHVNDLKQLMYATTSSKVVDFGAGDLTGLAELGRGKCVPGL